MRSMLASTILFALAVIRSTSSPSPIECLHAPSSGALRTIHQFSNGTWAENLSLRADGSILVTIYEGGTEKIVLITPQPDGPGILQVVHHFDDSQIGASGITELEPDIFFFNTFRRGSSVTNPPPGTGQVWSINLRCFDGTPVTATLVSNLTESIFLNGLTATHHEPERLLVADSQRGVVWRVDPDTGIYDISANVTSLTYTSSTLPLGVNGLHVKHDFVYFTNTQQRLFARYPISDSGLQTGPVEIIKSPTITSVDDFTLFPGPFDAAIFASDALNGTFFQDQDCTKRLAATNGTTANRVAWAQMKADGSVPVFVTSEGGVEAYGVPGPVKVGGTLSMFEMYLDDYWHGLMRESLDKYEGEGRAAA